MLKLENISKSFGDVQAVSNLSVEIEEGEIFVLLGPTGAGKTTTLKISAGLLKPDGGKVYIREKDVSDIPAAFREISFVFEGYNLFPIYNVYDNIAFALRSKITKVDKSEIDDRVRTFSKDLHIEHLLDRPTSTLSGGRNSACCAGKSTCSKSEPEPF